MIARAPAAQLLSWRLEKCKDAGAVDELEEARFLLTAHEPHRCDRYWLALQRVSAVM